MILFSYYATSLMIHGMVHRRPKNLKGVPFSLALLSVEVLHLGQTQTHLPPYFSRPLQFDAPLLWHSRGVQPKSLAEKQNPPFSSQIN